MLTKSYFGSALIILLFISIIASPSDAVVKRNCSHLVIANVSSIGENPRAISGGAAVYWLASYVIDEVLDGKLTKKDISVAHTVLKGNELENLRIGDRALLCLSTNQPNKKFSDTVLLSADYIGELMLLECNCRR